MTETEHYKLKKPAGNEYVGPEAFNENADTLDGLLRGLETGKADLDPATGKVKEELLPAMDYIPTAEKGAPGGVAVLDAQGKLPVESVPGGAADAVDEKLTAHTGNKSNPHGVTAAQVGARPSTWVPAWGDVSGKPGTMPPSAHTHGAGEITSGALDTARLPTVPLSKGGTGATTAAAARAALGACAKVAAVTVDVPVGSWAGSGPWTQTVAVAGVTAADEHIGVFPVDVADTDARKLYEKAYGCLAAEAETVAGGVTLTCRDAKPETSFQVRIKGVR